MPIKRVPTRKPRPLSTEQKVAFAILCFLGFGGVILGFRSFKVTISRPFDLQIAKYLKGERFLTTEQREAEEREASRTRDVDGDGLMDYDELYVYKTSPYLADSDSDGFDDKTEIFSSNDPNCPKDQVCRGQEDAGENEPLKGLVGAFGDSASILASGQVNFESPEDVKKFFEQATIQEIRSALLKAGVPKEQLDQIDDKTLTVFFTQTLQQASEEGTFDRFLNSQTAPEE